MRSLHLRCVLLAAFTLTGVFPPSAHAEDPETGVKLRVTVLTRGLPKIVGRDGEWVGTRDQHNSICGLGIAIDEPEPIPDLGIRYRFHVGNRGDTDWMTGLADFSPGGPQHNIQGICIELTGKAACQFDVFYQGYTKLYGETVVYKNGHFCGTRGAGLELESIVVVLKKRK